MEIKTVSDTHPAVVQLLGFHDNGATFLARYAPVGEKTQNRTTGSDVTLTGTVL